MKHMTTPQHGQYDVDSGYIFDSGTGQWHPAAAFYAKHKIETYSDADTRSSKAWIIAVSALGVLAVVLAIVITNWASADDTTSSAPDGQRFSSSEQAFLNALDDGNLSHNSGDAGFLADGEKICILLNDGYSAYTIAGELQQNSVNEQGEEGITNSQATKIVEAAQDYLCPGLA